MFVIAMVLVQFNSLFAAKLALLFCLSSLLAGCSSTSPVRSAQTEDDADNEVRISDPSADTAEPGIAGDSDGNLYVLYVEHAEDKTADLYLQKFDRDLHLSGEKVRINPNSGTVKTWAGDAPTIVIAPDKTILVGWTNRAGAGGTDYVLSSSRDGGASFSAPTKINDDDAPALHGMHSLAVDKDGTVFAAWLDERNIANGPAEPSVASARDSGFHFVKIDRQGPEIEYAPEPNSEVFFAFSKDGGKSFSKNQRLASDVCPCCKTAVTTDDSGRVYVSWRQVLDGDRRHIAVASSSTGGRTFSARTIVSDDNWRIAACPVSGAAIKATTSELNVSWYTAGAAGEAGYYTATSTDGGATFGTRVFVGGDATSGTPSMLRTDSGMTVVYQGAGNRTIVGSASQPTDFTTRSTIDAANNPSAVYANGATYVVFVRKKTKTRSVWIAKR